MRYVAEHKETLDPDFALYLNHQDGVPVAIGPHEGRENLGVPVAVSSPRSMVR